MTRTGLLVIAVIALVLGALALRCPPQVVHAPALTPAEMAELSPQAGQADAELEAAPPEPGGS